MTNLEFADHAIFQKIEQFQSTLIEKDVISKLEIEKINFFKTAIAYITDRLKTTISSLVSTHELTNISNELENGLSQLNSFLGNDNYGHVVNAENHIYSALSYMRNIPFLNNAGEFDFTKSINLFQQTIETGFNSFKSKEQELKQNLASLEEHINDRQSDLEILENRIKENSEIIKRKIDEFNSRFESNLKVYETSVNNDREVFKQELETDKGNLSQTASEIIADLNRKLGDANKLVNVIGNVGVTGNYQNIANHHKKTADIWRFVALGFMTLISILLIFSIWKIGDLNYDWHKAVIRIISIAILIYPATYASKESSKHRLLENANRKAELELASINPFIEILDETKKQEIKAKLVEKYFGNNQEPKLENEVGIPLDGLDKITKLITTLMKK